MFLLEPTQVEYKADSVAPTKSKRYLSLQELEASAEANRVGELYRQALSDLESKFEDQWPSKSSLRLVGELRGSLRVILSLIPTASSFQDGLRFQVYTARIQSYFGLDEEQLRMLLPPPLESFSRGKGDPWRSGWEGTFKTAEDIKRLAAGLPEDRGLTTV
jgi:hypothetical protein